MAHSPSSCALILAAGQSSRMGRDKALLPWPPNSSGTFLSETILTLGPLNDMVIVVAGKNLPGVAPIAYANHAVVIQNPAPERGQFSSLRIGLQEVLNRGRDAAMITLVDRPPVASSTLERLRNAFEIAVKNGKWAVVPESAGKHGHPYIVGREMIEAFLRASEESTAREVEHRNQQHIEYVPVADPFVTLNVDTPEQYAALVGAAR